MIVKSSQNTTSFFLLFLILFAFASASAQRRPNGRVAVVVDERLAALRDAPSPSAKLLRRLSRGRKVTIVGERGWREGVHFYRVAVTRRTRGWIQREAVVSASLAGDDERCFRLIEAAHDFDRMVRARIFLDTFPRSPLRPAVLLLFGDAAEHVAVKLSQDASRRLNANEMAAGGGPEFSYFLNYNGLDRYNRQGVRFVFDREQKRFHYDGTSWREIIRRYPRSAESTEARKRLGID